MSRVKQRSSDLHLLVKPNRPISGIRLSSGISRIRKRIYQSDTSTGFGLQQLFDNLHDLARWRFRLLFSAEICNESVKIYSGNGHTTSRVAAGMVFLSFGVVAAGRIIHKPTKPLGKKRIAKLRKNINLLNRIGKLLREEPTLGRIIASRKHIYVNGINVRKLLEDMGYLIHYNIGKIQLPIDDLSQTVEKSNYLKRKARIIEGGITRVEKQEANKLLKSAELLLCIAGLYHMLKGWNDPESPVNLSDIRLFIPA